VEPPSLNMGSVAERRYKSFQSRVVVVGSKSVPRYQVSEGAETPVYQGLRVVGNTGIESVTSAV